MPWQWSEPDAGGFVTKGKGKGKDKNPTELEARLMAKVRSAFHEAQSYTGKDVNRWAGRKAEWVCSCGERNFVERGQCRKCGTRWQMKFALIPAGSPPPQKSAAPAGQPAGMPPAGQAAAAKPPLQPAPASLEAAEAALAAAKLANAPPPVLEAWEEEVSKRRAAAETKVPPSIRARLATATGEANAAMQARERAQKRANSAKVELEEAEKQLQEASVEEQRAAAALRAVTAEVAPKPETPAQPEAAEDAQATEASLQSILAAFATAAKEGASLEEKEGLEQTLQQAKEQATAREAAKAAAAKAAAEAQAMAVERAEGCKRKSGEEEPSPTQPGDLDLLDEDLEALLKQVPPGKRQRAKERLTQLGVADGATVAP